MEKALLIIANGCVVTCDPNNRGGRLNLLIHDGRIGEISENLEYLRGAYPQATLVDAANKLIVPGFVNAHFHGESVLLKDLTDEKPYNSWSTDKRLRELTALLVDHARRSDLEQVYLMSYLSHLKSGTTCVGEFPPLLDGNGLGTMLQIIDRTSVKSVVALQNWNQISQIREKEQDSHRIAVYLGKEEDFTVYSFETLVRAAREMNCPMVAHIAEQREDAETVKRYFQKNTTFLLRDLDALRSNTLLLHLNHCNEQDAALIEEVDGTMTLCARSAAMKQTGYPMLRHLAQRNVRLSIGTDWGRVDMVEEMQFLKRLPLLFAGLPAYSSLELVRMATINGAHALGIADETGSIETGKAADLTFLSLNDLRVPVVSSTPTAAELANLLVSHLNSRDVCDVMIDGEFYIRDGNLKAMAEEDVMAGFLIAHDGLYAVAERKAGYPGLQNFAKEPGLGKARILPFVPRERAGVEDSRDFEKGFPRVEQQPEVPVTDEQSKNIIPPSQPQPKGRPITKPELSKDVKKVFGEDEEF